MRHVHPGNVKWISSNCDARAAVGSSHMVHGLDPLRPKRRRSSEVQLNCCRHAMAGARRLVEVNEKCRAAGPAVCARGRGGPGGPRSTLRVAPIAVPVDLVPHLTRPAD